MVDVKPSPLSDVIRVDAGQIGYYGLLFLHHSPPVFKIWALSIECNGNIQRCAATIAVQ